MSILKQRLFFRRLIVGLCLAGFFSWLALRQPDGHSVSADPRLVQRETYALGTLVSFSVYLPPDVAADAADQALNQAEALLQLREQTWSAWGDGALGQFNQSLAAGVAAPVPKALAPLFAQAWNLCRRSDGLFDPRIGGLVALWGFDDEAHYRDQPPSDTEIRNALASIQAAPDYVAGAAYGAAGITWDFGGIAKGAILNELSALLAQAGLQDHIINAGGNLLASGRRGDRGWNIGIRHPRARGQQTILASLTTRGQEAVVTSGDYERYFVYAGQRYHHLLDPRTGRPAPGLQSVTVVATDAALADAASTALFVAGADWPRIAAQLGVDQVLVVDADGRLAATPELAARLDDVGPVRIEPVRIEPARIEPAQ